METPAVLSTPQQHCPLHGKCPAPRPVPLGDASPAAVEAPTSGAALLVLHPPAGVDSETNGWEVWGQQRQRDVTQFQSFPHGIHRCL